MAHTHFMIPWRSVLEEKRDKLANNKSVDLHDYILTATFNHCKNRCCMSLDRVRLSIEKAEYITKFDCS